MPRMQPSEYNILLYLYFCCSLRCIYCSRSSTIAFCALCPFYYVLVAIGHSNITSPGLGFCTFSPHPVRNLASLLCSLFAILLIIPGGAASDCRLGLAVAYHNHVLPFQQDPSLSPQLSGRTDVCRASSEPDSGL